MSRSGLRRRILGMVAASLAVMACAVEGPALAQLTGESPGKAILQLAQKTKKKRPSKGATPAPEPSAPEPDPAKSADSLSREGKLVFSRDVAPILVANCAGCHNANPPQKRIKFDLSTFEKLMAGPPGGDQVVVPGKPEESSLVLRVKGEETPRMPPPGGNRGMSDAAVETLERWVKEGALLDAGKDPKAKLDTYAASPEDLRKAALAKLSVEERDKQVEAVGRERWKKANPKTEPTVTPSAHFLLFSTLPKDRAAAAVKTVENQLSDIRRFLGAPSTEWGEKASLFVFNDAISYGEFVQIQENREVETGDVGSARFGVPQPYVAVVDPLGGREDSTPSGAPKRSSRSRRGDDAASLGGPDRTLPGLLTEHLVTGIVSSTGKPPRWVSLGFGALMASRLESRSPYYTRIRREAYGLWEQGWIPKATEALGDQTRTDEVRAVGFAILEWMGVTNRSALGTFLQRMKEGGEKLDTVASNVLGGSREDLLKASGAYIASQYGRLR